MTLPMGIIKIEVMIPELARALTEFKTNRIRLLENLSTEVIAPRIAIGDQSFHNSGNGDLRVVGTPYHNGGDVAWSTPSDRRLKDIDGKYEYGLNDNKDNFLLERRVCVHVLLPILDSMYTHCETEARVHAGVAPQKFHYSDYGKLSVPCEQVSL